MNRCTHCREFFSDEERVVIKDDPSPAGLSLAPGYYEYSFCPECGAEDHDENFSLIDKLCFEEEDESSVIVSFEGISYMLYLDEYGMLECLKQGREPVSKDRDGKTAA